MLASGSGDGMVILWDVWSESQLATLEGDSWRVSSVSFSPDGSVLASGGGSDIVLWDVSSRSQLATLNGDSPVSFSPDGSMLVSKSHGITTVILWDVSQVASNWPLCKGIRLRVSNPYRFPPDGSLLAAGGWGNVFLWDVSSRRQLATLNAGSLVSFSPDGSLLAAGGGSAVFLWDVSSRRQLGFLRGGGPASFSPEGPVSFSPDGSMLVSGGRDNDVILWDVSSRSQLATLQEAKDRVLVRVVFSGRLHSGVRETGRQGNPLGRVER